MFERTTRLVSENLARAVNRRTFLKRTSQTAFVGLATLAAGHSLADRASAAHRPDGKPQTPFITCGPPGPYCNTGGGDLSGCHGAHCWQHLYNGQVLQCQIWTAFYPVGCWTSGDGWVCCDCQCGTPMATSCGCAQHTGQPQPLPDSPARGPSGN
jgi:hypothetical protein